MQFIVEAADEASREAEAIRQQVFGNEWGLVLPRIASYPAERRLTVLAREAASGRQAAALTVVETTGDSALHARLGLRFPAGARAARYTQLAVLVPYRGMDLPARLILEARRLFVAPRNIEFTWLLFDADRAESCSLCRHLGFRAGSRTYHTEYGSSRVLTREEFPSIACQAGPAQWNSTSLLRSQL